MLSPKSYSSIPILVFISMIQYHTVHLVETSTPWEDMDLSYEPKRGKKKKLVKSVEIRERLKTLLRKNSNWKKKFKNIIYKDENLVGKKLKFPNTDFLKMERN